MESLAYVAYCDFTDDKEGNPTSKLRFIARSRSATNSMFLIEKLIADYDQIRNVINYD